MAANTNSYTTLTLYGDVVDNGTQKVMLNATVRKDRYLQIHIEVLDPAYAEANAKAVQAAVTQFIADACATAAENGLPTGPGK